VTSMLAVLSSTTKHSCGFGLSIRGLRLLSGVQCRRLHARCVLPCVSNQLGNMAKCVQCLPASKTVC
jgi:hypothetical protein